MSYTAGRRAGNSSSTRVASSQNNFLLLSVIGWDFIARGNVWMWVFDMVGGGRRDSAVSCSSHT